MLKEHKPISTCSMHALGWGKGQVLFNLHNTYSYMFVFQHVIIHYLYKQVFILNVNTKSV